MIGYAMLGTNDIARARRFYDPLMAQLGAAPVAEYSSATRVWYARDTVGLIVITEPYDGKPATVGNGSMLALPLASRAAVREAHAKALQLGARNEGDPGIRVAPFYGAYFRDPDGHKFALYCLTPE